MLDECLPREANHHLAEYESICILPTARRTRVLQFISDRRDTI